MTDTKGMMYDGLIRCPFCYAENTDAAGFINHKRDCYFQLRYFLEKDKSKIKTAWNTRPIEDQLRAENGKLKEELEVARCEIDKKNEYIAELEQERQWIHQDKTLIVKKDGDSWFAVCPDFKDLQQSESRWFSGDISKYMDAVYSYLNGERLSLQEEE